MLSSESTSSVSNNKTKQVTFCLQSGAPEKNLADKDQNRSRSKWDRLVQSFSAAQDLSISYRQ